MNIGELVFSQTTQGLAGVSAGVASLIALKTSARNTVIALAILNTAAIAARMQVRYSFRKKARDTVELSYNIQNYFFKANIAGIGLAAGTVAYSLFRKHIPNLNQAIAYGFGVGVLINFIGDLIYIWRDRN